nr:serine/threonine transporter [Dongshaea marina]
MLGLYGTAIGAGVLFLPINAGIGGLWPLLVMLVLAFPMTYYSHRALCRFVLSGSSKKDDITEVVEEHFGRVSGQVITLLYFLAIWPILLMYSVAITNTTESFMVHQLGMTAPPRIILSLVLILALMGVVRFGQQMIVKAMSILVYPFVAVLMLLALYLIPNWSTELFTQASLTGSAAGEDGFWMSMWLIIPVMVFSFNHSPIISSFAVDQKQRYGKGADNKSSRILKYSHIMMLATVMFFVFSCVLSLNPADLAEAKAQNISILSYLANHFSTPVLAYAAPIVAFIAISKSFLGHYLGASEGLHGIIVKHLRNSKKTVKEKNLQRFVVLFMLLSCWIVATINPSILGMIETLGGPVIAMILFIMPMYAIHRIPALKSYKGKLSNVFITLMGLVAISAIIYGLFA